MRHEKPLEVIHTTRYAAVVRAFLAEYPQAVAKLDGKVQSGAPWAWCTNARLKAANNFSLRDGKVEVLGFHDGPRNMWADDDRLLSDLVAKKVIRLGKPEPKRPGLLSRLFGRA